MKRLPIVNLDIEGKERLYYIDERLGEFRSVDGNIPWIIPIAEAVALISWETRGGES